MPISAALPESQRQTTNSTSTRRFQPASVHLRQVNKSFGNGTTTREVLVDIDLHVQPGEVVAILGASGCGKSTLLRLAAGLEHATSGTVEVDGRRVTGIDQRCAVVFQEPRLLPWRSVLANVVLGLRGHGKEEEAERWLATVGLDDFARHLPYQISGGMAQRTALARALVGEPGVLLLDEPFAALDALTRMQMQDLLNNVVERTGATVLLVTHDIDEALYLADRIVLLGERGTGIVQTIPIAISRPRDRSNAALSPIRASLLAHFGIHS